jgi:hypothetical protein
MSTARDELAEDLFKVYEHAQLWQAEERAQRLYAAGWRKMPSAAEVIDAIYATATPRGIPKSAEWPYPVTVTELARSILALMEGSDG